MLGGLGGDTAELLGFQLDFHRFAHQGLLGIFGRLLGEHFLVRILDLFHDALEQGNGKLIGGRVHDDGDVFLAAEIPLHRDDDRGADFLQQVVPGDPFFLFQQLERFEKFSVVHDFYKPSKSLRLYISSEFPSSSNPSSSSIPSSQSSMA